ncbi:early nodulin-like protein 1 [Quercus robur]|uniref:early nodulin-like protein 1 n=1 Tax=Quercus robur TaxID=38942 RepID=UPI0021627625|nr:early nodulin-like protein 1 [Quercus robur]
MANTIFKLNPQNKVLYAVGLFCLMLLVQKGAATQFTVGGSKGWSVPSPNDVHFNQWAENSRFQIGDSLLFNYQPDQDSVLQVNQDSYNNCNTDSYQQKYTDGHTVVQLPQSGPFYFISGNKDNCQKNEKMVVIVLADRSNSSQNTNTTTSPPPSGSTDITPSPAPAGEESPSPPPTGEETPAPVSETPPPPPSGASSIFISSVTTLGAFTASSLYFLL